MADYNRRNRSGGGNRNFGKPRFNTNRQEMYSAICANCGKQCEVPFRPTGNKPVLCRDCFQNNKGADLRRSERRTFDRPHFNSEDTQSKPDYQAQFDMLNAKIDKILNLLAPQAGEVAPLESEISDETIAEIAEVIHDENKDTEEKKNKKKKSSKKTQN